MFAGFVKIFRNIEVSGGGFALPLPIAHPSEHDRSKNKTQCRK